jgi:hypothetical protein
VRRWNDFHDPARHVEDRPIVHVENGLPLAENPGFGELSGAQVRRINGRSVTVQRRRASFAIFVNG